MLRNIALNVALVGWSCFVLQTGSYAQTNADLVIASGSVDEHPRQPQLCVSPEGTIYCVFGIGNQIFLSTSTDKGVSFGTPLIVGSSPNVALGMRRGPRIAATENRKLCITAIGGERRKGQDGDLLAWSSSDSGLTWTGPVRVNDRADSAREGLHGIASNIKDGVFWCTWLDLRSQKTEIYTAFSADGGHNWSDNKLVYRSPSGSVCECCQPSIVASDANVHVLFRNSLEGNRDMYLLSLDNRGVATARPSKLGLGSWTMNMCPMDGGMLCLDSANEVAAAWRRESMVYLTDKSFDSEKILGRGEQPWIAHAGGRAFVAFVNRRDGDLLLYDALHGTREKIATRASDPVVVSHRVDRNRLFIAWESKDSGMPSIRFVSREID